MLIVLLILLPLATGTPSRPTPAGLLFQGEIDFGPTVDSDYVGGDYSVTVSSTAPAPNAAEGAVQCAAACAHEARCVAWTYWNWNLFGRVFPEPLTA